jgi:hypothetical protein
MGRLQSDRDGNPSPDLKVSADDGARSRHELSNSLPNLDSARTQKIFADLTSDWAFIVRVETDGAWQREWIAGGLPSDPTLDLEALDPECWDSYIADEDRDLSVEHFWRAIARGVDRLEYRLDLPGAGVRWVESSLKSVPFEDGSGTIRVFGAMRDITERRATEQALQESEFDTSPTSTP